MNKTEALKTAKAHIRMYRSGTGWVLVTPYSANELDSTIQESRQMDYWMARSQRTLSVCWLAMRLMGYRDDGDIYWALDNRHTTINDMLDGALDKIAKLAKVTE